MPIRFCASPLTQVTLVASTPASLAYVGKRLRTTEPGVSASFLPSRSFGELMLLPSSGGDARHGALLDRGHRGEVLGLAVAELEQAAGEVDRAEVGLAADDGLDHATGALPRA